jgi:hypothetical protein
MKMNGFIEIGSDVLEGNKSFNVLLIRSEFVNLLGLLEIPDIDFRFDSKVASAEQSLISLIRKMKIPCVSFIGRVLSILGIDVHKIRNS